MTPAEFKAKWARFSGKESSAYQEHFNDLCRMLRLPSPVAADPTGSETFCFQKRVVKDVELFNFDDGGHVADSADNQRGFADVWKKDCFGWEYKGPGEDLEKAYKQLLRYRESLLNPPLLVVCDFRRFIVRTNFNGTVQEVYEFTNAQVDDPTNLRVLGAVLSEPDFLKPQRTTAEVTEKLARQIAEVAKSLQRRESRELADAKTRAEMNVAQRKNLRIARFLNRVVFCFFAEDTGLLPKNLFSDIAKVGLNDPKHFAQTLEKLFAVMANGGTFGKDKIRHFNGHLFEESTVFELTEDELRALSEAGEADWQFIQPSIMGTLFERALEPEQRAQLGAHYTSEADIKTLVEPVLMAPLRREWRVLKGELAAAFAKGKGTPAQREKLVALQKKLAAVTVLDPACGSGNFLYVSLQLLLDLEKEIIAFATQLGFKFAPQVSVQQLRAIEINPYAFELAQVSVQIGFLQWRRDNGFDNDRSPVLQDLDGFQNEDALLVHHFRNKPKTLKQAQAGEHAKDDALKFYTEREWPKCEVIVGNPPFLGGKLLRRELGDDCTDALFQTFGERVRPEADLCCYWFEKAREQIEHGKCKRAGLLATQGIRGGANREVLKRIKGTGDIFFAESDREWILAGANVHVSMVGFDDGSETQRLLNGHAAAAIHSNLSAATADTTVAKPLRTNFNIAYMGDTKGGAFDITEEQALEMMTNPNPYGLPNSDVIVPWVNGLDVTRRQRGMFIIDFGFEQSAARSACYELPFAYVNRQVRPEREKNNRALYAKYWWRHVEPRPGMLKAIEPLQRFLTTVAVSKHRLFVWMEAPTLPDHAVFSFARDDDFSFGVLHSRFHEVWALAQGTQVREKESGFRYTPTTCFETFPFPFAFDMEGENALQFVAQLRAAHYHTAHDNVVQEEPPPAMPNEHGSAIADAAQELNALRERWLNPPEWTETRLLKFPGSVSGPWARYVDQATVNAKTSVGTVRYPRLEPRDADCAAKLKKRTLTNLYNERPAWLDLAHKKLDASVADAYGFPADLSDEQILERLLALNLERAAEEAKAAKTAKPKTSREKNGDEML